MRTAFVPPLEGADDEADLTGISAIRELYVSEALHETFVAVDEHGTEAAAATALIIGVVTSAPTSVTFTVDRPFLFWIEHTPTSELLFLGQVTTQRPAEHGLGRRKRVSRQNHTAPEVPIPDR